eukprot:3646481-Heterocapsa_arctica.AAC.1
MGSLQAPAIIDKLRMGYMFRKNKRAKDLNKANTPLGSVASVTGAPVSVPPLFEGSGYVKGPVKEKEEINEVVGFATHR